MLTHTVEFARTHRFLGCMGESFIESCHVKVNVLFYDIHINLRKKHGERLRRSLADISLSAIQTALLP